MHVCSGIDADKRAEDVDRIGGASRLRDSSASIKS